jgi:hypothetical protein
MPRRLTCSVTNLGCTNDTLAAGNSYDYIFYMEPDTRPIRKFWLDKARPNNGQRYPSFCANLLRKCRGVAARARLSCCTRLVPAQRTHSSCAVHAGCDGGARCVAVLGEGVDWTVRA